MIDERLAALAGLSPVRGVGDAISLGYERFSLGRAVRGDLFDEGGDRHLSNLYRPGILLLYACVLHANILTLR